MQKVAAIFGHVETVCARLTGGLVAVAVVLAIVTTVVAMARCPLCALSGIEAERGVSEP